MSVIDITATARLHNDLTNLDIITNHTADPARPVTYTVGMDGQMWKTIGRITISAYTQRIGVHPCNGPHIGTADMDALNERAVTVWKDLMSPQGDWLYCWSDELGAHWEQTVTIPVTGFTTPSPIVSPN